ncbi:acetyltransferase (GNAT) family protein [Arcicella aurantiaca]|uniref:Acetyltransferase (GNAT) family protein n=1 Tax=Arcicella aurantiaca TaxID=591202 RepID=A0A316EXL6_9BACT|nr:GNAT family N-acetyltransferase [Arcicella aurantiaca]PWK27954.1 acetyltransferase (GNAT) family protein [Arcicella aurantiaca]
MLEIKEIQPSDTWEIRHRVMWADKPIEYVKLSEDENGLHFGLFKEANLVSIVSLFIENDSAQFRKFATEISEQGKGYGGQLLGYLIEETKQRNVKKIWCNARLTATGLYQKFGFQIVSEHWLKDGVEYVKMERNL